jgi:hypothetical protein
MRGVDIAAVAHDLDSLDERNDGRHSLVGDEDFVGNDAGNQIIAALLGAPRMPCDGERSAS